MGRKCASLAGDFRCVSFPAVKSAVGAACSFDQSCAYSLTRDHARVPIYEQRAVSGDKMEAAYWSRERVASTAVSARGRRSILDTPWKDCGMSHTLLRPNTVASQQ